MASNSPSGPRVTWNQKLTDFAFVLKSGQELRCHKFVLATNSPVLDGMLSNDFNETKSNRMTIEHFDEDTVVSFLQYMYAKVFKGQEGVEYERLNFDLLRMARYFQVEELQNDCTERLEANICDDNVMSVWMEAEKHGFERLCSTAIGHLIDRGREGPALQHVSGFMEAFATHYKPLKTLFTAMHDRNYRLKEEIVDLKRKVEELEEGTFKLTLVRKREWTEEFRVRQTDTIEAVLLKLTNLRPPPSEQDYLISKHQLFQNSIAILRKTSTLEENNIHQNDPLFVYCSCLRSQKVLVAKNFA